MRGQPRFIGLKQGKDWHLGALSARPEPGDYPRLLARTALSWVPTAKKNRHRIARFGRPCPVCGERKAGIRASRRSEADQEALAFLGASLRAKAPYTPPTDHALSLRVTYLVGPRAGLDRVLVELWDLGPEGPPSSPLLRRGRARDLDNLVQGIADAWQGQLYENDRQLAELVVHRRPLSDLKPKETLPMSSRKRSHDRVGPPCKAHRADGRLCGRPATETSAKRGCMVCHEHADPPEPPKHPNPNWTYQVCPKCKHITETHRSLPLLTRCPKCDASYVTAGPSKDEVGR